MKIRKEEWKTVVVPGYDNTHYSDYMVSSYGRVKSIKYKKERMLKLLKHVDDYRLVSMCVNGKPKMYLVHQLVVWTFMGNQGVDYVIDHIDANRSNNNINNLRWLTQHDNVKHSIAMGNRGKGEKSSNVKFKTSDIIKIKKALSKPYYGIGTALSKKYNVSPSTISYIKNGEKWTHIKI